MSILSDQLPKSNLGLKNVTPANFGVDPIPPDSLHLSYSTTGTPPVSWRLISGEGMKPSPSQLDDLKSLYKPGAGSYMNNKPL